MRNIIERAVLISPPDRRELPLSQMFSVEHTPVEQPEKKEEKTESLSMPDLDLPLHEALNQFEQKYIQAVIEKNSGQLNEAARSLGIHRTTLYRKQLKK